MGRDGGGGEEGEEENRLRVVSKVHHFLQCTCGRWVAKLGRWLAKLVAHLLATAALWVRIQTYIINTKRVANTS
jgi:hypothetical protein